MNNDKQKSFSEEAKKSAISIMEKTKQVNINTLYNALFPKR